MSLVFHCELSLACTYSLRRPDLARACAAKALFVALQMNRPDLAYQANSLLSAI